MSRDPRLGVSALAVRTPLGESIEALFTSFELGRTRVVRNPNPFIAALEFPFGVSFEAFDFDERFAAAEQRLKAQLGDATWEPVRKRLLKLKKAPSFGVKLALLVGLDLAWRSGYFLRTWDPTRVGVVVAGDDLSDMYVFQQTRRFLDDPGSIDAGFVPGHFDTDHGAALSMLLLAQGFVGNVGGVCASGNLALSVASDKLRLDELDLAFVIAPPFDYSPVSTQGTILKGATPPPEAHGDLDQLCCPFDANRSGLVPGLGAGGLMLERVESIAASGGTCLAELLAVASTVDGTYSMRPEPQLQAQAMKRALERARLRPEDVDFISCHATSTPAGDATELQAIGLALPGCEKRVVLNAPKSLLGHTFMACATIEAALAIWQMKHGWLHQSFHVRTLDPAVKHEVCHTGPVKKDIKYFMKNSFGFGGINSVSLFGNPAL